VDSWCTEGFPLAERVHILVTSCVRPVTTGHDFYRGFQALLQGVGELVLYEKNTMAGSTE
jgi:hypothetical protein